MPEADASRAIIPNVSEWEGTHRPALEKIKGLIQELVGQLQSDINQQRETSSA